MKKTIIPLVLTIMSVVLASCSVPEKDNKFHDMDSKTFFEKVTLPEKLSIDIKLDDIKNIDKANSYKAEQVNFDKQKLINAFIKNKIGEEKIWAEGPQVLASADNIEEVLNTHDGGKSFFGVGDGNTGGFSYGRLIPNRFWRKPDIVANPQFSDPDINAQKYGYSLNSDYASHKDLDFLPYEDSLEDIKRILSTIGMSQFSVDETYSLDLETMKAHYKLYLKSKRAEDDKKNLNWTKDDECYIFSLQQLIDNIPIVNNVWQMPDGTKSSAWGNPMPATLINLIYDKKGIMDISAGSIMNTISEIENNKLINVYEALNTLIEDYSLTILEDDIRIISAELCYLSIPNKDGFYEMVPGWVFRSSKAEEIDGEPYVSYKYDVINAVTGKLYQDRW
jgi:hypothetical protein